MIVDVGSDKSVTINLGRQGENAVTEVTFDFSAFYDEFGQGSIALVMQRTKLDEPYPIILDVDGTEATWTVSSIDTAYKGTGKVQLFYIVNKQIKKSVIFKTKVEASIETEDLPDDPYLSYLEQMTAIGADVKSSADHIDEVASTIDEVASTIDETATEVSSIDSSLRAFVTHAQSDLSGARTDALGAIDTAKTGAVSDINTAKSGALTNINSAQDTALGEIGSAKSGALSDIATSKTGALTDVATAKTGATTDIASARSGALTDIGSAKTNALSDIETALDDAIEEISKVTYTYTDTGDGDIVIERTGE